MRIEAYAQVQSLYKTGNHRQVRPETPKSFMDQLQISSLGKDTQIARQAVEETPDVRSSLVADIKSRISNGSYDVDTADFAGRLFQRYNAV